MVGVDYGDGVSNVSESYFAEDLLTWVVEHHEGDEAFEACSRVAKNSLDDFDTSCDRAEGLVSLMHCYLSIFDSIFLADECYRDGGCSEDAKVSEFVKFTFVAEESDIV